MIPEINSEVFSILSLQAHYCPIESNKEFAEQLDIFLKTRLNSMLKVSNLPINRNSKFISEINIPSLMDQLYFYF